MPGPFLIDLSHTAHTQARTGVQRAARALARHWGDRALPVCHDPYERRWRPLDPWELRDLAAEAPGKGRRAQWPLRARLRGWIRRRQGRSDPIAAALRGAEPRAFLTPEIFSPEVASSLGSVVPGGRVARAAVFYDAVVLRHPELSPRGTVARFPAYLRELLEFDGVAAISEESREALVSYWRWLGVSNPPPVVAIPLGVDPPAAVPTPLSAAPAGAEASVVRARAEPTVLCVGTLEGRKNHLALLEACERLWQEGARFELRLIGTVHAQTGRSALQRVRALQAAGRPLRYDGAAPEEVLAAAYAECSFTAYPSIAEGFGLPVAESLIRGKPCVCSNRGAVGEIASGGGCLGLTELTSDALAGAIVRLLDSPTELAALSEAARRRRFRTWAEYAEILADWLANLPARPPRSGLGRTAASQLR